MPLSLLGASLHLVACSVDEPDAPSLERAEHAATAATAAPAAVTPPATAPERVGWPQGVAIALDRGCPDAACVGDALAIEVTNLRSDSVEVQVFLAAAGLDGRSARVRADGRTSGAVTLKSGEQRRFTVGAAAMPIQPLGSLASAWAELAVIGGQGAAGSASSPVAYEHAPGFQALTLYDDAGALARGGRLDPLALEQPAGRVWNGQAHVELATLVAKGGEGHRILGGTRRAAQLLDFEPVPWPGDPQPGTRVCFNLKVRYNDAGVGEDYLADPPSPSGTPAVQYQRASFMRAFLTHASAGTVWTGYLDRDGCTGPHLIWGTFTLHVQSQFEKLVGGEPAHHDVFQHTSSGDTIVEWTRSFTVVPGGATTVELDAIAPDHTMNVAGVLARMYMGLESQTMVPKYSHKTYVDKGCPDFSPPTDSCSASEAVYIGPGAAPGPAQANAKFLVAHEYGHFVQKRRASLHNFHYHAAEWDVVPACRCDHVVSANQLHCMQSLEQYTAAIVEGYAHFYAATLFNNRLGSDCYVGYYKELLTPYGTLSPTVPISCASDESWRVSNCNNLPGRAVELDVMRFLWSLYSHLPDRLSMAEILEIIDGAQDAAGYNQPIQWNHILAGATAIFGDSPKFGKVFLESLVHGLH